MEDIAVVKKRGRPPKGGNASAAPAAGSPIETIPKKRGRPSKSKGRGRPAKVIAASSDNEDNDQNELDDTNDEQPIKTSGSGKGRGRPRKEPMPVDDNSNNDDDADSFDDKPTTKQQKSSSAKRRKLGRPRKHQPSDEGEDDDEEEEDRRPVGRPATGAVNLNIVRTGRGAGRPKKNKSGGLKRSTQASSADGDETPKKRGRPSSNNKATPYVPSGRPRGRPKVNNQSLKVSAEESDEQDHESEHEDESGEAEELTVVLSTPKKRGRPSMPDNNKNPSSVGKSRGRPKVQKSPSFHLDDDPEDQDSSTEIYDESNLTKKRGQSQFGKSRGRPKETGNKDANGADDDEEGNSSDGDGDNLSEESAKQTPRKVSKSETKADGEGDAGHDNGESVECISDEPSWAEA